MVTSLEKISAGMAQRANPSSAAPAGLKDLGGGVPTSLSALQSLLGEAKQASARHQSLVDSDISAIVKAEDIEKRHIESLGDSLPKAQRQEMLAKLLKQIRRDTTVKSEAFRYARLAELKSASERATKAAQLFASPLDLATARGMGNEKIRELANDFARLHRAQIAREANHTLALPDGEEKQNRASALALAVGNMDDKPFDPAALCARVFAAEFSAIHNAIDDIRRAFDSSHAINRALESGDFTGGVSNISAGLARRAREGQAGGASDEQTPEMKEFIARVVAATRDATGPQNRG